TLTEEGVLTYQIRVGDPSRIKRLQIQNNFAISNDRLIATCDFSRLYPVYNKADVDTDVAAMEALYRKNNYPTATIAPKFTAKTGLLQFQINEGKRVEFDFVFDTNELSSSQQNTFKEEIGKLISTGSPSLWERRIKAYFENEGYHGTTIQETVLAASSVQLTINPGTRYRVTRVTFSGNRAFSDADLLREMTVKPTGRFLWNLRISNLIARFLSRREQKRFFDKDDLQNDEHRLDILYEKAGYPNAVIEITDKKQPLNGRNIGEVTIQVSVFEDRKEVIHRCTISGNRAIDTATLLKRLESELPLPQPNASFERTVYQNAIRNVYDELGYIDVKVNDTYISETETAVFEVEGNFSESLADGKLPLEIRDEFKRHNLTLIGLGIATNVGNRWSIQDIDGNPRYTLKQEPTHLEVFEHGILNLAVETEGEQVTFGKFYFEGDTDVVKQHVLEREVRHLAGERWTSDGLSRALQNLSGLGIFRSVQAEPRGPEKIAGGDGVKTTDAENPHAILRTYDVLVTVEKQQQPRTFSYGGGYGFAEGWNGTLELTNSNFLFKRNIRGSFRSRLGWRDELGYLVDARLTEPWLIGRTRGTLRLSAKKLEIDDNVRALQGSFILSRKLGESHRLDLRYSYRDLNQPVSPMEQGTPPELSLSEEQNAFSTTVSSLRFSWTYDARVRYLNPIGGMFNELTLEYAGGFLQGGTSFIKTTTDTRYYQKLIGSLVLATAVRCGITTGLRSNRRAELISFERFWAGGSTTVRGYAERSLGPEDSTGTYRGDVQFIFNTELRFPIYSVIRGAFFFDAGNVWDSLADIETLTRLPSAVGAGLYLDFGALTVGLDYAIPLVSVPSSPDTRRAHFRLGSTF
ncbi:BamA/TamA family outer membrane protein, partial [Candidatus Poribacteria bacterium]|nr:BamA/TamA family outer membrane protein [Candidatus Poribacteria bacterium]